MAAHSATELVGISSDCFSAGDTDGLLELHEEEALFPTIMGLSRGQGRIRTVLQGHINSGATIAFDRQVAFETGDLALVQNGWTLTTSGGDTVTGASVEVAGKPSDGTWKYVIDSPAGAALLSH